MNTVKRVLIPCVLGFLLFLASAVFAQSDPLTSLPGRIAYISTDYNVHTFNFAQQQTHELTQDGSNSTRYQWVTWSFDGRLAYFCCDLQAAQSLDTSAHISPDGVQPGKVVFSEYASPVVYAAWSPRLCADSEGCLDLAMLVNDAQSGGFRIELVRDSGASESRMSVSNGAPFFYSWSPDGAQMVFHRNGNTLDVYDVAGADLTTAEVAAPNTFQAPAWSPVDDRILSAIRGAGRGKTSLIITTQGASQTLIPDMSGVVSFSWSPDGRYIAYRIINDQLFGALFVVDAVSGQVVSRSSTSGVIAFFWSPDSRKLAYVTFEQAGALNSANAQSSPFIDTNPAMVQDIEGLMWSMLDIETGLNRSYSSFVPTTELVYLFLYFDQFAQSHRIWSPDSSHIVYTELTRRDGALKSQVSVLNVTQPNSTPLQVAEGVFAVWSFD